MFLRFDEAASRYVVCNVLGDMDPVALPADVLRRTAETVVSHTKRTKAVDAAGLGAGKTLIENIFSAAPLDAAFMHAHVAQLPVDASTGLVSGNEWGAHDLPAEPPAEFADSGSWLPFGYGSVPGLMTIAGVRKDSPVGRAIGEKTIDTAARFKNAVHDLYDAMAPAFDEQHVAFTGNHVPVYFASSHSPANAIGRRNNRIIAFAQNIIDEPKAPLHLVRKAQAGGSSSSSSQSSLAGTLAAVPGADADEQAVLAAARQQLASGTAAVTPAVRDVFASAQSLAAFRTQYEASKFNKTYARAVSDKAEAADRQQIRDNVSFGLFATNHLSETMRTAGPQAVANLMHGLIAGMLNNPPAAKSMESALATAAATTPDEATVTGASRQSSSSSSSSAASGRDSVLTRLAHSPTAIHRAGAAVRSLFAQAEFHDLRERVDMHDALAVNAAEKLTSNAGISALFSHGLAGPAISAAAGGGGKGRKRQRDLYAGAVAEFGGFPADLRRDDVLANISPSVNLNARKAEADKVSDALLQHAMYAVLLAPITMATFQRFYDNNIRIPLSILGERPARRYETASAIFAAGGERLGMIPWYNLDVQLSANANIKTIEGNVSIWAGAVIIRPERYFIAEDVLVTGYLGGESLVPFSADPSDQDRFFNPNNLDNIAASVFYFLVPAGSLRGSGSVARSHDIRGRFTESLIDGRLTGAARSLVASRPHYASALYYTTLYRFNEFGEVPVEVTDLFRQHGRQQNTVTHQTMQWMWNPHTGVWDLPILNTDHFGKNIYEGHGDLRVMNRGAVYKETEYKYSALE